MASQYLHGTGGVYDNLQEASLHQRAIESLAAHSHISKDRIAELYESELVKIKKTAKIKDFLSVLVIKKVKVAVGDMRRQQAG